MIEHGMRSPPNSWGTTESPRRRPRGTVSNSDPFRSLRSPRYHASDLGHLVKSRTKGQSRAEREHFLQADMGEAVRMSKHKKSSPKLSAKPSPRPSPQGSDWTRLLTDPDLVSHLATLLQTYREVEPQQREAALLRAMR